MRFSEIEIQDLFKAWIALSVAFAIIIGRDIFSIAFLYNFIIAAITVGIGFLLHEMGHKYVAQKYGCFAEFRSFDMMLVLAIAMSFVGFIFAAPGAVMISGHVDRSRSGRISIAGPLMSFFIALVFIAVLWVHSGDPKAMISILRSADVSGLPLIQLICYIGAKVNAFIALFNLLPLSVLDGKKIYQWNKLAYFTMLIIAGFVVAVIF
ncbi:peptidase M50 [Candidatus Woesearchaeota archaeon CG10_big_fil_rev_8_21_14_0_10_44_13]|nr:MAG: peptidase M50 [Candidatus Woesearchaeota archaeon CG10_big_fil_rev_8_21_14_0_10_44_13]